MIRKSTHWLLLTFYVYSISCFGSTLHPTDALSFKCVNNDSQTPNYSIVELVKNGVHLDLNRKKLLKKTLNKLQDNTLSEEGRNSLKKIRYNPNPRLAKNKYSKLRVSVADNDCIGEGRYRLMGDFNDHIDYRFDGLSSVKIKLSDFNIDQITSFRLYVPQARNEKFEILATYLFSKFGFLAPRSAIIPVTVNNGGVIKRIFQEEIDKNFLEFNKVNNGFLFKGNEKAGLSTVFSTPLLVNENLIENEIYAKKADLVFRELMNVYLYSGYHSSNLNLDTNGRTSDVDPLVLPRYFRSVSLNEITQFYLLSHIINAKHGLTKDDSRFVYDISQQIFRPIYYDGDVFKDFSKHNSSQALVPFSISQSDKGNLLKKIKNLKKLDVIDDLGRLGAYFDIEELSNIVDTMIFNLNMATYESSKLNVDSERLTYEAILDDWTKVIKISDPSFLVKVNTNKYLFCDKNKNKNKLSCEINEIIFPEKDFISNLLTQKLANINKKYEKSIYLDLSALGFETKSEEKIIYHKVLPDLEIISSPDVKIKVSKEQKTITIYSSEQSSDDKFVQIRNGTLSDWHLFVKPGSLGIGIDNTSLNHKNLLSGCLTFTNVVMKDVKIHMFDSICEDAIHFTGVTGNNLELEISNSASDALDADFSNLHFKQVLILDSGNDCVDFSAGNYKVTEINVTNCGDKGVSVGEKASVEITDLNVNRAKMGVASKDYSLTKIEKSEIKNVDLCFAAYRKKLEFGPSIISVGDASCSSEFDDFVQIGSKIN